MIPFEQSWGTENPHVAVTQIITGDEAGQAMPKRVDKTWGYELHYKNDNQYCMKLLHFNGPQGETCDMNDPTVSTSMHFHVQKHETLLVTKGVLTLELLVNKKTVIQKLQPGQAWVVCPGHIHRLSAIEGPLDIVEASTYDQADDSVRVN